MRTGKTSWDRILRLMFLLCLAMKTFLICRTFTVPVVSPGYLTVGRNYQKLTFKTTAYTECRSADDMDFGTVFPIHF